MKGREINRSKYQRGKNKNYMINSRRNASTNYLKVEDYLIEKDGEFQLLGYVYRNGYGNSYVKVKICGSSQQTGGNFDHFLFAIFDDTILITISIDKNKN